MGAAQAIPYDATDEYQIRAALATQVAAERRATGDLLHVLGSVEGRRLLWGAISLFGDAPMKSNDPMEMARALGARDMAMYFRDKILEAFEGDPSILHRMEIAASQPPDIATDILDDPGTDLYE